ncbi:hypothetical protein HPB49_010647 [Dermacentor silvarum]|uniref:Uncharacterized protein n=1 Tax=Dermacentor silvarum TaxID=543639 RepID=A0ACB8DCT2_DERSI|nr:hypothetical protein HPB49_010647 [Dermacentor silvarum]
MYDGGTACGAFGSQKLWHPTREDARQIDLRSDHLRTSAHTFLYEGGLVVHTMPPIPQIGTLLQGLRRNQSMAGSMT